MDKAYTKEFRDHKAEVDDRLKRIEDRLDAMDAQSAVDEQSVCASASATSTKKSAAEAVSSEKEAN
ncbi:hypothetical protein [Rhizobium rhizogenes]|uniref:hypothetical protein n=1 Tax=Rhizobium rhizogenes TaxID=359 RepID=UPI0004D7B133|nr:hypothetical protein [Rhizobium rhizogenes]KEA07125.1 hypothetical protein CN09_09220 [Rhizobium rhizogenes]NTI80449.1 hypothetical protein [Rhizobium rhizogenes]NTJ22635.1 hypothetical protein [Rhizobium rhizogenes]QUE81338.1 hypothetical protein EML492_05900 [Rhizobium rhizogenes]TQO80566.1 hypothetical protein FFE80_05540 [Rhizobium rhizogenes]